MIGRIWHGYTTQPNADVYENLLKEEIFTNIRNRHTPGFHAIQLLRRDLGSEVEFITIMWFDDIESVKAFLRGLGEREPERGEAFRLRGPLDEIHRRLLEARKQAPRPPQPDFAMIYPD